MDILSIEFYKKNREQVFTYCSSDVIMQSEESTDLREKTMKNTEEREQKILQFMRDELRTKGYPPTVREICSALGIKSTSTAHKAIESLVRKGYLKKDPSKPRALMLVPQQDEEPTRLPDADLPRDNVERTDIIDVPVVGRVAAGTPITAEQNIESTFPVPSQYVQGDCYMLRVRGESMINAGIMDGDMILVEHTNTARNGEMVVAMIDGFESEATVKTFYKENGHVRLQPENDTMSPIIVNSVSIQGKVKGVFRFFQ